MDAHDSAAEPATRDVAVSGILNEVDSLLDDCDKRISAEDYASATPLAIRAFETGGKAYALRFDLAPTREGVDLGQYHRAVALTGLCFATLRKYNIDEQQFYTNILPFAQPPENEADTSTPEDRLKALVGTTLEPVMRNQSAERNMQLGADVRNLVDIGRQVQSGEGSGGAAASREVAERWAWAADGIFHLLQRGQHHHPPIDEVAVLLQVLGQKQAA